MHISKDQRIDAISDRDQMAEKPPSEHAKKWMKRPAYYGVLGYLARQKVKRNKIDTGEEMGRGQECSDPVRGDEGRNKRFEETDS